MASNRLQSYFMSMKADGEPTLPEQMGELHGQIIILKRTANDVAKDEFKEGVYRFEVSDSKAGTGVRLRRMANKGDHFTTDLIPYRIVREIFEVFPKEISENIFEILKKRMTK